MTYVVEFSQSQKAYHISSLTERMINEARCILRKVESDWKVIYECDSWLKAYEFYKGQTFQYAIY